MNAYSSCAGFWIWTVFPPAPEVSVMEVCKNMGGEKARATVPKCPKGYSINMIPHSALKTSAKE